MSFYLIIFAVILMTGCSLNDKTDGNGNITSSEREATGFTGVVLEGAGNINIHFSENFKVIVTTDSNIQEIITIEVKNNLLYVDGKRGNGINPTKLEIDVYLPELKNIMLKGAGNIEAQNYEVENISVNISGAGNTKLWVKNNLTGSISGVGNIYYKGDPKIDITITGIGSCKKL